MMKENFAIHGVATALSPVVHGAILSTKADGEVVPFRTYNYMLPQDGGVFSKPVPCISGNAVRGLGRRLLVMHSIEDVLGLDLGELAKQCPELAKDGGIAKKIRHVMMMFLSGGTLVKGFTIDGSTPAAVYEQTKNRIPWLSLLGGIYVAHHFESCAKVGLLVPVTTETNTLLNLPVSADSKEREYDKLIGKDFVCQSIDSLGTETIWHMKKAIASDVSENPDFENDAEVKNRGMYAQTVLPAGIKFFSYNTCATDNEGTRLAFYAMFALISKYGYLGGSTRSGYGHMDFAFDFDVDDALQTYDQFLLDHRKDVEDGIISIMSQFHYGKKTKGKGGDDGNDGK